MRKVTIQEVLGAGGDIFGLPVKLPPIRLTIENLEGVCIDTAANKDGEVSVMVLHNDGTSGEKIRQADAIEVHPDGIRILEIDGKLYRVTGHLEDHYTDYKNMGHQEPLLVAKFEPLIPEKPAVDTSLADLQNEAAALAVKIDKLRAVMRDRALSGSRGMAQSSSKVRKD